MKRIFALLIFAALALVTPTQGQTQGQTQGRQKSKMAYAGFSGGMMVHTGYLYGGSITPTDATGGALYTRELSGAPFGLGGVARVHFGEHLRVGAEGYVSTLKYGDNESHARIGWGGILADCIWQSGRWAPYVGGTVGGGGFRNLTLEGETSLDFEVEKNASYRRYGFMMVAPFAGVEYAMTDKIRLNLKVDWLVNLTNRRADFAGGPRLYLGFSFYRLKEQ